MRITTSRTSAALPLALATALLALGACKPKEDPAAAPAGEAPQAAAVEAGAVPAAPADAAGAVRAAFDKFLAVKSYRASMGGLGGMPASTIEFVAPDRYRIKLGEAMEQVRIGDDLYTVAGGKTTHSKAGPDMPSPRQSSQQIVDALATATVEALGEETIDGQTAKVYRIATTQPAPADNKVWISTSSGLPLKSEATVPGAPTPMAVTYSDYDDASISIEPPAAK